MTDWSAEVELDKPGSVTETETIETVFDVQTQKRDGEAVTTGEVVLPRTRRLQQGILPGNKIKLLYQGVIRATGNVTSKNSDSDGLELTIGFKSEERALQSEIVNRAFYAIDPAKMVRRMINKRARDLDRRYITRGDNLSAQNTLDDLSNWQSNTDVLELGNIPNQSPHTFGQDFIFAGIRQTANRNITNKDNAFFVISYDGVSPTSVPNNTGGEDITASAPDGLQKLVARLAVNNAGGVFDVEIRLTDYYNTDVSPDTRDYRQYHWQPDIGKEATGFQEIELPIEEAQQESVLEKRKTGDSKIYKEIDGNLAIGIELLGELEDHRGIGIDYFYSIPYTEEEREPTIVPGNIQPANQPVTRRFDRNRFEAINNLATEIGYQLLKSEKSNEIDFIPRGDAKAGPSITYGAKGERGATVVDAEFNKDFSEIKNKVTVQGAGDVRVTLENGDSVKYYGIAPKQKPIVDKQIQSDKEARQRARGFLRKHAFNEEMFTFTLANQDFANVRSGQRIFVNWPPQNISGDFFVTQKKKDADGFIELSLTKKL